ncbi:MAG: GAF domain-containing protein [Caldilinea sp.]|nr:GAF domain-containing protein [Caldilinea sp.]MDW8442550.1 GAF domain-containing protein [Caldilineaceae bacterium]
MTSSGIVSLAGLIGEHLAQIESALNAAPSNSGRAGDETVVTRFAKEQSQGYVGAMDRGAILSSVRELQRLFDRLLFLEKCTSLFAAPLSLSEELNQLMDALWQRHSLAFAALVLGEAELGPYFYHDLRGILDARRYLKKQCPLPLWGELAHALVRPLDPEEPDYLLIDDIAEEDRPKPEEFPWMPRRGSVLFLPLRKENVAIGALILGGGAPDYFADPELRLELVEFAQIAARVVIGAQIQEELQERSGQLVGLQLFTRLLAASLSSPRILSIVLNGIAELMRAVTVLIVFRRTLIGDALHRLSMETPGARILQDLICVSRSESDPIALLSRLQKLLIWTTDAGQSLFLDPSQPLESPDNLYYNESGQALITPITVGDAPLGAIYIEAASDAPAYSEEDMVVMRTAVNMVAIVLQQID